MLSKFSRVAALAFATVVGVVAGEAKAATYDFNPTGLLANTVGNTLNVNGGSVNANVTIDNVLTASSPVSGSSFTFSGALVNAVPADPYQATDFSSASFQLTVGTDTIQTAPGDFAGVAMLHLNGMTELVFNKFTFNSTVYNSQLTLDLIFPGTGPLASTGVSPVQADVVFDVPTAAPLPAAAWSGMALLAGVGVIRRRRNAV